MCRHSPSCPSLPAPIRLTKQAVQRYRKSITRSAQRVQENIMGNRDKRGREKKKPKKSATAPVSRPAYKPIVDYKPTTPAAPPPAPPTENKP
jgi:hypothetical protein